MKQIRLEMPTVAKCDVEHCAYNVTRKCRAKAITIGDSLDPECDTYLRSASHTHEGKRIAGVGAFKVRGCVFNQDLECTADSIAVGVDGTKVHCFTYAPRSD